VSNDDQIGSVSRRSVLRGFAALPAWPWFASTAAAADAPAMTVDQVLNLMEFEALAHAALPPAHFAYLATGVDDDRTVGLNHEAFSHIEIRSRRFVDVSRLDTSVRVLGTAWTSPIYLSAVSGMRAFHAEGEAAVARAAATRSTQMMLSTGSSVPLESVREARGAPVWQQLYATDDWRVTEGLVRRAEAAGCPAIVLTVDTNNPRNTETLTRGMRADTRLCTACHIDNSHDMVHRAPLFQGLDVSRVHEISPTNLTWEFLDRLRALVRGKLLVKGIVAGEDAALALRHGIDGIVVSNHGGRAEETLRPSIECLPEVAAAVSGRIPVFLDGGIRRGTDVFKALALGASGVGIGRPQAWGLAAFGQPGVEAVLDILNRELKLIMRQAGTPSIAAIDAGHIVRRSA
jgi:4-hydroxymandelate oxidase